MAICRPEAIDAAPACGPERSGGCPRGDFLASRGMGEAQGKKVEPPPLRLRRSRRSRPLARSAKREAVGRAPNSILGEVVANLKGPAQEDRHYGRRGGGRGVEKGRHRLSPTGRRQRASPASCRLRQRNGPREVVIESCVRLSRRDERSPPHLANLFDDWRRKERQRPWSCSRPSAGE